MSDEGESELSMPIQIGSRRLSTRPPAVSYTARRNNRTAPAGIGGDVVGSMKRGIKTHSGDQSRREARVRMLCTIAGALFCVLSAIWIQRLYTHWIAWYRS